MMHKVVVVDDGMRWALWKSKGTIVNLSLRFWFSYLADNRNELPLFESVCREARENERWFLCNQETNMRTQWPDLVKGGFTSEGELDERHFSAGYALWFSSVEHETKRAEKTEQPSKTCKEKVAVLVVSTGARKREESRCLFFAVVVVDSSQESEWERERAKKRQW